MFRNPRFWIVAWVCLCALCVLGLAAGIAQSNWCTISHSC